MAILLNCFDRALNLPYVTFHTTEADTQLDVFLTIVHAVNGPV